MNSLAKKAKCFVVVAVLAGLVLDVSAAQAVPIEFNFEGLAPTTSNGTISTYMSGVYGSTIVANDVDVSSNSSPSKTWTGNTTQWLINSAGSGDLEIHFKNRPIEKLFGTTRGYVFAATDGADFVIKAYDSGFGDIENPNAAASVFQQSFSVASAGTEVDIPDVVFSRPVSLLVFSDRDESDVDHGEFHVGIDDLTVQPVQPVAAVPEPATLALLGSGLVGLGFLGRKRWFRTVKS